MVKIIVINNYGQFCHLIHRAVRDLDQEAELMKNTSSIEEILSREPDGLILSGGPSLERSGNCSLYVKEIDLPVLGICLGHQVMAQAYGGAVRTGAAGGYAAVEIEILEEDDILKGLGQKTKVWASHADEVSSLPPDFIRLARSKICEIEAMKHKTKPLYGVQWHPEVSHTERGNDLLNNFFEICQSF
ncbi:GMP synthase, glutamine-hydrolyzing, N-terminal domain or A subunit [Candidatus Methanoperedens nitroreducens]|uniref:GMP synthase [glutamine-hydrolyzing] subunit A n=1 Tax=Candidatus Methanoperedens nitratireducens TaxID=1392998 RepID=A0A062UWW9_9EURY|nr:GMP synthase, glutamine-hydrolyzing, N-terminal domain or A subunit [Candidatus Methanoperedens nitroreducens]